MFGKLMKYELRYLMRIFVPMWLMMLGLCILSRITAWDILSTELEFVPILVGMAVYMAFIAVIIVCEVVIVVRFYKGMYGDEGYLMFTLPVTNRALIHSRGLSATIVSVITFIVGLIGVLVMTSYQEVWEAAGEVPEAMDTYMGVTGTETMLLFFWMLMCMLVGVVSNIYSIYMCISIGQMWRKHPVAGGILAYYGLSMVLSGAMQAIILPLSVTGDLGWMERLMEMDVELLIMGMLIILTVAYAVLGLICYLVTKLLVDKRLNIA